MSSKDLGPVPFLEACGLKSSFAWPARAVSEIGAWPFLGSLISYILGKESAVPKYFANPRIIGYH